MYIYVNILQLSLKMDLVISTLHPDSMEPLRAVGTKRNLHLSTGMKSLVKIIAIKINFDLFVE